MCEQWRSCHFMRIGTVVWGNLLPTNQQWKCVNRDSYEAWTRRIGVNLSIKACIEMGWRHDRILHNFEGFLQKSINCVYLRLPLCSILEVITRVSLNPCVDPIAVHKVILCDIIISPQLLLLGAFKVKHCLPGRLAVVKPTSASCLWFGVVVGGPSWAKYCFS